ncbi:MAG: FAD-dependent monooxygenase, partial [Pseudomonadota bacterium]
MTTRRDIVIAGGGMVGLSLALHLAYSLPRDCSISLVEGFSVPAPGASDAYHPSFDARSTALSYSSERILGNIDVWDTLSRWSCPIRSIHVSNQGRFGSTLMRATDYHWAALGHVVENAWLGNALLDVLQRRGEVELLSPVRVTAANTDRDGVRLTLEGAGPSELVTSLLVVADGAGSGLRGQLGMAVEEKPYGQQALVANIATAQAHNGCAFERFTPGGPLAMLPLVDAPGAENRSALVWTLEQGLGSELCDCDECEFLQRLQREFGYRLGRLQTVSRRPPRVPRSPSR